MEYLVYAHIAKGIDGYAYIGMGDENRPYSSWRRSDKEHKQLIKSKALDVEILSRHDNQQDAFDEERHMIRIHQPYFNKYMYDRNVKPSSELTDKEIKMRKIEREQWWSNRQSLEAQ
jgi:hypothetical protein